MSSMLRLANPFPLVRLIASGFSSVAGKLYHRGKDSIRAPGVERQGRATANSTPPYGNGVLT